MPGQLGLEPLHDCGGWATGNDCGGCYVCTMRAVFAEVRRVLRDDGTLWLNLGDSYNGSGGAGGDYNPGGLKDGQPKYPGHRGAGLKPKDLCGIPWRVALALQADGWYLRSDIIWAKPNPMPESVTDRPAKAHEYLFLLAKSQRYYFDQDAIREPIKDVTIKRLSQPNFENQTGGPKDPKSGNRSERRTLENLKERYTKQGVWDDRQEGYENWDKTGGRNKRTVWEIATAPYSGAHFATYPPALVEPCVKAGTSERGVCPRCGAGWVRTVRVETEYHQVRPTTDKAESRENGVHYRPNSRETGGVSGARKINTTGWLPSCSCPAADPIPATVFDPFNGSGTTGMVAEMLGRRYVGTDLSPEYLRLAQERIGHRAWEEWTGGRRVATADLGPLFAEASSD